MTEPLDPLDERLQEYAARWAAALPPPPALPGDVTPQRSRGPKAVVLHRSSLAPGRRSGAVTDPPTELASARIRRGWLWPAVAAAAVAGVVLAVAWTSARPTDSVAVGTPSVSTVISIAPDLEGTPSPGPSAATTVPWAALPPTHPTIPATVTPATPDPHAADGLPTCTAAALTADSFTAAGLGTTYLVISLHMTSDSAQCRLVGTPRIESLRNGKVVDIPQTALTTPDDSTSPMVYPHPVRAAYGVPVQVSLSWSNWCAPAVAQTHVRISWTGSGGSLTVPGFGSSPGCQVDPTTTTARSPFAVGTFAPREVSPPGASTAYDGVVASMSEPVAPVPVGRPISVVITLTAPHDLVLDPCPDFVGGEGLAVGSAPSIGLNCAGVAHRDRQGRPYLPAGVPVSFAVQLPAPTGTGDAKLWWQLTLPDGAPPVSAGGAVRVG